MVQLKSCGSRLKVIRMTFKEEWNRRAALVEKGLVTELKARKAYNETSDCRRKKIAPDSFNGGSRCCRKKW